jgi:hypothetical protein
MQVGKIYTHPADSNRIHYECVKLLPNGKAAVVWSDHGSDFCSMINRLNDYQEYKEPRKGTFWVNVYSDGIGTTHKTKEIALAAAYIGNRLACVEVPWIEGQGLTKGVDPNYTGPGSHG